MKLWVRLGLRTESQFPRGPRTSVGPSSYTSTTDTVLSPTPHPYLILENLSRIKRCSQWSYPFVMKFLTCWRLWTSVSLKPIWQEVPKVRATLWDHSVIPGASNASFQHNSRSPETGLGRLPLVNLHVEAFIVIHPKTYSGPKDASDKIHICPSMQSSLYAMPTKGTMVLRSCPWPEYLAHYPCTSTWDLCDPGGSTGVFPFLTGLIE